MLTRYFTVVAENRKSGYKGPVSLGSRREQKMTLTAVIQERTACTIIEPSFGVDLRRRGAYAVPRNSALRHHLGR